MGRSYLDIRLSRVKGAWGGGEDWGLGLQVGEEVESGELGARPPFNFATLEFIKSRNVHCSYGCISSCSPCVELSATLWPFQQQPTTWASMWKTDLRDHLVERGKTPWRFRSDRVKKKSDKDGDSDGNLELTPISGRVRQKSKQHLSWEI